MKILIIFLLNYLSIFDQPIVPNYRAQYRLTYKPDSTNLSRTASEKYLLFIKENKFSYSASENLLKADSIKKLLKKGLLTSGDFMTNESIRYKTNFMQFVQKDYTQKTTNLHENMRIIFFTYPLPKPLTWEITADQETLNGYACTKATTTYAGRNYIAWFTSEIPIADGPYIFGGLPGLIVKIYDTKNHYVFSLEQFSKYEGEITEAPTYRAKQPIASDQAKVMAMREELKKDPLGFTTRVTGHSFEHATVSSNGSNRTVPASVGMAEAVKNRSWDNNPLELK
jgi:GLPGLI family protein